VPATRIRAMTLSPVTAVATYCQNH